MTMFRNRFMNPNEVFDIPHYTGTLESAQEVASLYHDNSFHWSDKDMLLRGDKTTECISFRCVRGSGSVSATTFSLDKYVIQAQYLPDYIVDKFPFRELFGIEFLDMSELYILGFEEIECDDCI